MKYILDNLSKLAVAIICVSTITKTRYWLELSFASFLLLVYDSLMSGNIRNRSFVRKYRNKEPTEYWFYVCLYIALMVMLFVLLAIKWIKKTI